MTITKKPTLLMILDGYGFNPSTTGNAIAQANKKNIDALFSQYPHTLIGASGLEVGLPVGQMGNSEVGHLNIGAGRVVYQELTKITLAIEEGTFFENAELNRAVDHALAKGSALHLIGLLSDGGVHSHITHLYALLSLAKRKGLKKVYLHTFLDGRDVPPQSAVTYFEMLEEEMKTSGVGEIAMISGRYYAMDRDNRWERVVQAYDAMTVGSQQRAATASKALEASYAREEYDEFVLPTSLEKTDGEIVTINDHDAVIMFNFRPDRAREITRAFVDPNFGGFEHKKVIDDLCYVCLTQYDAEMPNVSVAFPPQSLKNTFGEYLSHLGLRQLRIAETEKYAHVTFFFNGGVEAPNNGEERILIPSPQVATYDLQPEMSAYLVTERVVQAIKEEDFDVIILNYANPDMVGHTGKMPAAIAAIEAIDKCIPQVVEALKEKNGQMILTADHGNADYMTDEEGQIVTAHSTNPVPLLVLSQEPVALRADGILADVVPTMLDLMGLEKPAEMTGKSLLVK